MIRDATTEDREAIRAVHLSAFPTALEADLVETLAVGGEATLSLVAEHDDSIVGHVLCSRMTVEADGSPVRAVGLAPVAVSPEHQGQGMGAALIRAAIDRSAASEQMIFVLGEPDYYTRFEFSAEAARPFASPYTGDYFMAIRLDGASPPRAGKADYAPAFAALEEEA